MGLEMAVRMALMKAVSTVEMMAVQLGLILVGKKVGKKVGKMAH